MASSTTDRRLGLTGGTAFKAPVKAATTANLTLSAAQTIDGVSCVTGDRVLVKNQTTASENGIYVVDSGSWTRDLDFDGINDVVQGTQVYVNTGGSSNGGATFVVTNSGTITPGTTSLTFSRTGAGTITKTSNTATAGQMVFTVATYQTGANAIEVYVDGHRVELTKDYTETDTTTITFTYALVLNQEVVTYSVVPTDTLVATAATGVSVSDAGDYYIGATVEAVLQEIASAITADVGDASATLIYNTSTSVQRWNTALTANRTATLSTTGAREGANFIIVRGAGATGNFTLAVGSLATLRAPGEWAQCKYDAGTSAWVLVTYGTLPSAEIAAMSADKGDASATLTVGTSERTSRWATALTADRTCTLATAGAWSGARLDVERTEAATGAFSLIVAVGATTLLRLAPGQSASFVYTGTTWIVFAFHPIRPALTSVVTLHDDFLGAEIDGYKWQSLIGTDSAAQQAIVLPSQVGGVVRLTTGDDAAASMAVNGVQLHSDLNWAANQGGLIFEARLKIDAITSVCVFLGLTDQIAALEMPFTLGASDALTSNASNAVGVLFDTGADTDNWWAVGVAADVDAAKENLAVAPVAATRETWRIEVGATGTATFYRNGVLIGTAMASAVTAATSLTPVIAAFSRTNVSRNIDADEILVQMQR